MSNFTIIVKDVFIMLMLLFLFFLRPIFAIIWLFREPLKVNDTGQWHKYYAWYLMYFAGYGWRWLCYVERRYWSFGGTSETFDDGWSFRALGKPNGKY